MIGLRKKKPYIKPTHCSDCGEQLLDNNSLNSPLIKIKMVQLLMRQQTLV